MFSAMMMWVFGPQDVTRTVEIGAAGTNFTPPMSRAERRARRENKNLRARRRARIAKKQDALLFWGGIELSREENKTSSRAARLAAREENKSARREAAQQALARREAAHIEWMARSEAALSAPAPTPAKVVAKAATRASRPSRPEGKGRPSRPLTQKPFKGMWPRTSPRLVDYIWEFGKHEGTRQYRLHRARLVANGGIPTMAEKDRMLIDKLVGFPTKKQGRRS